MLQPQEQFFGMFSNYSRSNYHSGQFTVRKRFSQGLSVTANYTLAKSLDITSAAESRGNRADGSSGEGLLHDPYNPDAQYTYSDFDRRHQFNGNFLVELPFGRGRWIGADMPAALNHVVGGWDISGIVVITSGRTYNYTANSRYNHHYFGRSIPRIVAPFETGLIKQNGEVYFIGPTEADRRRIARENFANVYPGSPIARNEGRGPGFWNLDMSVSKAIQFTEGVRGKLRVESFNAFNHPNFSISTSGGGDIDSAGGANMGRITSTQGDMRVFQFSFRLEF
ncbi:MAG: hypothetical protein HY646_20200 [Acidobacteria bacterium]|nr:hypothetical protein [Acidobacteriota bacterium]